MTGATMSPRIFISPFMEPIHFTVEAVGDDGTTSATGFPKRVIRIGRWVLRTLSSSARHFALNSEMAISSMTCRLYHGHNLWSIYGHRYLSPQGANLSPFSATQDQRQPIFGIAYHHHFG